MTQATFPIFLNCPFTEKDQAKKLGARFNGAVKKWYVPIGLDIENFERWLPDDFDFASLNAPPSVNHIDSPETPQINQGISLSTLLLTVKNALSQNLAPFYWVKAEIVDIREKTHYYFELSEHDAQGVEIAKTKACLWQNQAQLILPQFEQQTGMKLTDGMTVLMQISVEFHPVYGFSLTIQSIDANYTLGELAAKIQRIRQQLIDEGIYQRNRALATPQDFCRIAVIAPEQAAGLGDFQSQTIWLESVQLCEFQYFYATFQGKMASAEICEAIEQVNQAHQQQAFDALVIIRGGGAKADLYQLNEYAICKAICLANLPVIVGIGHERDQTLLDEVANFRCHTPSLVIAHITSCIVQNAKTAQQHWQNILYQAKQHLQQANTNSQQHYRIIQEQAAFLLKQQQQTLNNLLQQLHEDAHLQLSNARRQIQHYMETILIGDPQRVLQRGYVLVRDAQRQIISSQSMAKNHTSLSLEFKDGILEVNPKTN